MRLWRPVLDQLKVPAVGLHTLRHSAAARMIAAGAQPKMIQKVMGHWSVAFTLTVYGHIFDDDLDDLEVHRRVDEIKYLDTSPLAGSPPHAAEGAR
jgi:integrase